MSKFPNGLQFTVEMGNQPYLTFVTGDGASLDNLFVPPGVKSFRVVLKNGGQEFNSNTVSDNFVAKKKQDFEDSVDGAGPSAIEDYGADR